MKTRISRHHLRQRLRTIVCDVYFTFGQVALVEFPASFSRKTISREVLTDLVAAQLKSEFSRYMLNSIRRVETTIYNGNKIVGHDVANVVRSQSAAA